MIRSIVVTHTPVLPIRSGSARRRWNTIAALSSLGPVDLLLVGHAGRAGAAQADLPVERVIDVPCQRRRPSVLSRVRWMAYPTEPYEFLEWDRTGQVNIALTGSYDLAWYCRAISHALAPPIQAAHRIVDLDDLEDEKLRARRRLVEADFSERLVWARNTLAWSRTQRRLARVVDMVALCSEEDCSCLGASNCAVLPNAVPPARKPVGGAARPVILLVGLFSYEPNADSAEFLVREVLPLLREEVPDVEVRLVGRSTRRVAALGGPNVRVIGEVEDLGAEYRNAAVVVAPVRVGSGTRVKIIEALAHGVPVVATPLGAAGLGVRDRVHCLLAQTPEELAAACRELLYDVDLGRRLSAAGIALHKESFSTDAFNRRIQNIVAAAPRDG
jgi:glycosyltransferase involved in cell wall biosynthesis